MADTQPSISLEDFAADAASHLKRLRETGEAQTLMIDGEPAAVVLSPQAYDAMQHLLEEHERIEGMRQAINEIEEGKAQPLDEVFADVRAAIASRARESA